jgi:hypothetical protein
MPDPKDIRPRAAAQAPAQAGPQSKSHPGPQAKSQPGSQASKEAAPQQGASGRVVHDARGNAVWDWVKETSRIAIESTSRLLRKLEITELKVEDSKDEELRIESDRDPGGGYDPYNQVTPTRKPGRK